MRDFFHLNREHNELRYLTRTTITVELAKEINLNIIQGIYDISQFNKKWRFSVETNEMENVMNKLASLGIKNLIAEPPTLEELFMRHYGDKMKGRS